MVAPKHPPPLVRERPAPAPYLTEQGQCSDCSMDAITAADEMLVCPRCYALLWHTDQSTAQRAAREAAVTARAAVVAQRQAIIAARELARPHKRIRPIRLSISAPVIGVGIMGTVNEPN